MVNEGLEIVASVQKRYDGYKRNHFEHDEYGELLLKQFMLKGKIAESFETTRQMNAGEQLVVILNCK
jgi:hypothetical protein